MFELTVGGRRSEISDVFPGFEERNRLGLVMRRPCGAVGASTLILVTVTAFYDIQRAKGGEFFVYPDYFLFHVGGSFGNHKMLDIFPAHKEVVVEDDPEELLRAINDRAVTRLLVEDVEPGDPTFERPTLASSRILTALAYFPRGRARDADVEVSGSATTEAYVSAVLDQSEEVDQGIRDDVWAGRKGLFEDGVPLETYRRLGIEEALGMLASPTFRQ